LYTFVFVGEDPARGNILPTILESRPEIHFASCEVLSPQTPKFELKIQLRHGAGSEDEQREIVHELITGALGKFKEEEEAEWGGRRWWWRKRWREERWGANLRRID
jgi:DNA-directed RNA polymerase subunit L